MPISKQKKTEILEKLRKAVKDSKAIAFVNFHGLTVAGITEVRRQLRASNVGYMVAKKTLAKKALSEAGFTGELPELQGELGIAYSADLIAPAREVFTFQKKFENKISLVGGVFDGKYMNKEAMTSIALIPSQQTLYAQFVNLINSPLQGLVMALDGIAKKKA
jgi:large subunit ribosomal protein L10